MTSSTPFPIEILGKVFTYLPKYRDNPHIRSAPLPAWLAVTHVCRQWRLASLSFLRLWSEIITSNLRWTEESLRRSGDAPIQINIEWNANNGPLPGILSLVLSHAHRATSLALATHHISQYISNIFGRPFPHLKTLCLLDLSEMPPFIGLASSDMPMLGLLRICHCFVPWTSPLFPPTITSLKLTHIRPEHRPSMNEFRALIHSMPNLEFLDIHDALPLDPPLFGVTPSELNIPRAVSIVVITTSVQAIAVFLLALRVPPASNVSICYIHDEAEAQREMPIVLWLSVSLSLFVQHSILSPTPREYDWLRIRGFSSSIAWDFDLPSPSSTLPTPGYAPYGQEACVKLIIQSRRETSVTLTSTFFKDASESLIFVSRLLLTLLPTVFTSLRIQNLTFVRPYHWWYTFARAEQVHHIRVDGAHVTCGFLLALNGAGRDLNVLRQFDHIVEGMFYKFGVAIRRTGTAPVPLTETTPWLFPALERLSIASVNFATKIPLVEGVNEGEETVFLRLRHTLRQLVDEPEDEAGRRWPKLMRLDITKCGITPEQVAELKEVLGTEVVVWDGRTHGGRS